MRSQSPHGTTDTQRMVEEDANSFFGISSGGRGGTLIDQNKYENRLPATFDEEANR